MEAIGSFNNEGDIAGRRLGMTTEQRMEKLERDLACAKRVIVVGAAIVLGALAVQASLAYSTRQQKVIRANEIFLTDRNGNTRVRLDACPLPRLDLLDTNGTSRIKLIATTLSRLTLHDKNGEPCQFSSGLGLARTIRRW